jgi:hypothetical protein
LDFNRKTGKVTPVIEEAEEDAQSGEEPVKSSPEDTPNIKKKSVTGLSKLKSEEGAGKSSPEGSPKLKKKSVTDQSKVNGKVTNSGSKKESSAKSTKGSGKNGQSSGKTPVKTTVQRKISDPSKSKK